MRENEVLFLSCMIFFLLFKSSCHPIYMNKYVGSYHAKEARKHALVINIHSDHTYLYLLRFHMFGTLVYKGVWENSKDTLFLSPFPQEDGHKTIFIEADSIMNKDNRRVIDVFKRKDSTRLSMNLIAAYSNGDTIVHHPDSAGNVLLYRDSLESIQTDYLEFLDSTYVLENPLAKNITIYFQTQDVYEQPPQTELCWLIKRRYLIPCDWDAKQGMRFFKIR